MRGTVTRGLWLLAWLMGTFNAAASHAADLAAVLPNRPLEFPQDFGSHPQFRTEWWYLTGWLSTPRGERLGFQITFFRTKPQIDDHNPSAFTPRQLLIAHCAISDPKRGRLWQDQRIRRAGLGLADALTGETQVWVDGWSLKREAPVYKANVDGVDFALHLALEQTQTLLINGNQGVSQKGPAAESSSYYYSEPHLKVTGTVARERNSDDVTGEAWLDHEWSSEYLDPEAVGWDWVGINLADGGALMAFRMRNAQGNQHWAGGSLRSADGSVTILGPSAVQFRPAREWRSPRTGIPYPVQWTLRIGERYFLIEPLMNDQENDTRLSTGTIYWEGAVELLEANQPIGRGYLELTGYGDRLKLP